MRTKKANIVGLVLVALGFMAMVFGCASQSTTTPSESQSSTSALAAVQSISTSEKDDVVEVAIVADRPLTFSSLKQPDPLSVVLYLPDTSVDQVAALQAVNIGSVRDIAVKNGSGNQTARVEIGLTADVDYTAVRLDNKVLLSIQKKAAPENRIASETLSSSSSQAALKAKSSPAKPAASANKATSGRKGEIAWVNKVDFLSEPDGRSTVVVGTSHAVDYDLVKIAPQRLEIHFPNTRIPSYRQRPLITTRFNSAIDRITPVQPAGGRNESVITIELREAVAYVAEQNDAVLMVHFDPSDIPPKPLEQANLPDYKQTLSTSDAPVPQVELSANPVGAAEKMPMKSAAMPSANLEEKMLEEDAEVQSLLGPREKVYSGEKIALDFYETDIKNVFRILREVSGKNFAIDKDVTGKVTMTLDNPVPWDQVLDLVLRMNQLGMVQEGNIIRVATLETLKGEDDLRKAKLEALRKAREDAKALEPLMTKYIAVSYSNAAKEVKPHLDQIITKERGSLSVDEKNNQIIMTDTAAKIRQAEEIIRRIDKVTSQVVIEAKVVEVNDSFSRKLGIEWDMEYGPGELFGYDGTTNAAMNFPVASTSSIGISFSRLSGVPFVLNAKLDALEETGDGKILSSPKILTLDNKKAKIKQGVEYAYLERDSSGGSSVKFKDIDLLLEVTPHVTPDNRISLSIYLTKNDVASLTSDGIPSVATNEAQTELLVNDGDTVVIGGIIKTTETNDVGGFPFLKDIPVLGYAFKNTRKETQNNELLIFITPRIVQLEQVVAKTK